MTLSRDSSLAVVVCRAAESWCGIPVPRVLEAMRPLPIRSIRGAPEFVLGVCTVRGIQTPVVDLGHFLFGPTGRRQPRAFLSLRAKARSTVLALDRVIGVHTLPLATLQELPALLAGAASEGVSALGTLDEELLLILESGVALPEELWATFERMGAV